ncbi:hypothetical protein BDW69DRAFT_185322 [Aspergillus filifer]
MHENAIIAIITITALSVIAACGTYLYYLRGNLKKEITIRRVEAQKERLQAVQVASNHLVRERGQQREREWGRERERAQVRKPSASRARSRGRGRNRARSISISGPVRGRRGSKVGGEGPLLLVDVDRELEKVREERERKGSRAPVVSRAASTAPAPAQDTGEWGPTDGLTTNTVQAQSQPQQEQDQGQEQQLNWSFGGQGNDDNNNDWPAPQEANETQDAQAANNGASQDEWGNNNNNNDDNSGNAGNGGGWTADDNKPADDSNANNGASAWKALDPAQTGQRDTQPAAPNVPEAMNW